MCAILTMLETHARISLLQAFLGIIPTTLDPALKKEKTDVTRCRKLPFSKVMACTLSRVANGNHNGVDIHAGKLFRDARRSGLWPDAEAIHRSALSKARKKVPWEIFQDTLNNAVRLAYDLWPDNPLYTWHGMSVFATDGSKYTLPATELIRKEFDHNSGLGNPGKGH